MPNVPNTTADFAKGDRVNYICALYPNGLDATVITTDETFVVVRFDRDADIGTSFSVDPEDLTKLSGSPSRTESLLRRALQACNTAKRFRFAVFDDSYKLAADIESYLKATTGKTYPNT